ncbi:MAG: 4Fe-4S binding protein, partial [Clostridia bacterium]|nr:4Fe-4S binding protein [Clostridia bacterium]
INGVAVVDKELCGGCGKCVTACPKQVIRVIDADSRAVVTCKNADKGAETRKVCKTGCIGCMKCQKVCEYGAVTVTNFVATVDNDKCVGCGKCEEACPQHIIKVMH